MNFGLFPHIVLLTSSLFYDPIFDGTCILEVRKVKCIYKENHQHIHHYFPKFLKRRLYICNKKSIDYDPRRVGNQFTGNSDLLSILSIYIFYISISIPLRKEQYKGLLYFTFDEAQNDCLPRVGHWNMMNKLNILGYKN
ncbi:hypothetical protein ACJX0J_030266 [Zea mays]